MNSTAPTISIIMPCYNAGKYIAESIQSVLSQTYLDWELIIIDDKSTDDSIQQITTFNDPRIHLIKLEQNQGAGGCRNAGLQKVQGAYIAFLDSDDLWKPNKLEISLSYLQKNPKTAVVCTGYSFINENGEKIRGLVSPSSQITLHQYMMNTSIGCSTALVNRDLTGEFSFSTLRQHQDAHLWITFLLKNLKVDGLKDILVEYRIRDKQISQGKVKAAKRLLKLYLSFDEIPLYKRYFYFFSYCVNGVIKRIKR